MTDKGKSIHFFSSGFLIVLGLFFSHTPIFASVGTGQITGSIEGQPIVIKTASWIAGAIDSITWKGKEFVFSELSGQQIQTAFTVNTWGECYNPTESGTEHDGKGPSTSSKVLSFKTTATSIESRAQMAFWFSPDKKAQGSNYYSKTCFFNPSTPGLWDGGYILNTTTLSDFILNKKITLGYRNLPNVIEYTSQITVPADLRLNLSNLKKSTKQENPATNLRFLVVEHPATYLRSDFNTLYWYDPMKDPTVTSLTTGGEFSPRNSPVAATSDGAYAIGLFSPIMLEGKKPVPENPYFSYVMYDWRQRAKTVKLSTSLQVKGEELVQQKISLQSFLVIGSLQEVLNSIHTLATGKTPVLPLKSNTPVPNSASSNPRTIMPTVPSATPVMPKTGSGTPEQFGASVFLLIKTNFGNQGDGIRNGDLNNDGIVDGLDYMIWYKGYRQSK